MSGEITYDWQVTLKGNDLPVTVPASIDPVLFADSGLIVFRDADDKAVGVFPINAVASAVRTATRSATYPLDQTPTGAWLRNVKTDGTGHWVPYTGPLFGVKE